MTATPERHDELDEIDEAGTEVVPIESDALVDSQVATARRYPRSVARFKKEATGLACLDEDTAGECMYALPRDGRTIEGPSARLAEILLYTWGNARAEAEVIDEGETHVTAAGTFYDLERNVAVRKKVKRRITDRNNRRFSADMIGVTGNAAVSIALRNAVLAGIPKALWRPIYDRARRASIGQAGTLTKAREKFLTLFEKMGVQREQVFGLLEVQGLEDLTEDHLIQLRGLANAIRDGEATVEGTFNPRTTQGVGGPSLQDRVKQKQAGERADGAAE